jgi:hypothetical protein
MYKIYVNMYKIYVNMYKIYVNMYKIYVNIYNIKLKEKKEKKEKEDTSLSATIRDDFRLFSIKVDMASSKKNFGRKYPRGSNSF